jgi:hypothetical protein
MASKKDQFLLALDNQIQAFQQAYDTIKTLPDAVFEAVYGSINGNAAMPISTINTPHHGKSELEEEEDLSWAKSRKGLVLRIIESNNTVIQKKDIIKKFRSAYPNLASKAEAIVTYALSGLRGDGLIKSYNPSENKDPKSGFWTLPAWWDGETLKSDYKPKLHKLAMVK